jgi:glycosyltransferase EpsH
LVNQTLYDLEIILVNDGSTDESGQICDMYASKDNRIKVIHKSNGGLSDARNAGIRKAVGKYIMFIDSDDWIDLTTCEDVYQAALFEDLDIVFWSSIYEYTNKSVLFKSSLKEDTLFSDSSLAKLQLRMCGLTEEEMKNPVSTDYYASAWGKLYNSNLIKNNSIEFIDTKIIGSEDVLFNFTAFHYSKKIKYLNKFYYHYRKNNPNSLTKNQKNLSIRFQNLFEYMKTEIERLQLGEEYLKVLQNRIGLSVINISLSICSETNKESIVVKIGRIKNVINEPPYANAIKQLKLSNMPLYWKVYFVLCKNNFSTFVYANTYIAIFVRKILSF